MADILDKIGSFSSEIGAEITAYDPISQELFVVSGGTEVQVLDLSDPSNPTQAIPPIDIASLIPDIDGANSVAYSNGLLALALEASTSTDPGKVAIVDIAAFRTNPADPNALKVVQAGPLPDMLMFTPDGTKILVANEGVADDGIDPEGSISIIDVSSGLATLTQDNVATADFSAFNGREAEFRAKGVRIFPDKTVAEDVEPEFIAVSSDGTTAFVNLQENNAFAVLDLESATVVDILPLGVKDHSQGQPTLELFEFNDLPVLGTTEGGQEIKLGGLSGLFYEGTDAATGNLKFVTVPDRGPNGEPTDVDGDGSKERPFALPDYQARVIRFELNPSSGEITITETIFLTRQDSTTPITGLPNIAGVDEEPVDLSGNLLPLDEFGADLEGVVIAADGTFWMVDEYRPAIYHFDAHGVLIDRFVAQGTAALAGAAAGTFGTESLPEEYANRRRNRGFEAVALDPDDNILYAFIQTPLQNPDRATSNSSDVIRILGIDTTTGNAVAEYVYLLEDPALRSGGRVDKIGDAVYAEDGKLFVIERDSAVGDKAKKFIFQIDLTKATNLLAPDAPTLATDSTLEQLSADDLDALGIQAVNKIKVTNLPSIGYLAGDKPEGLALLDDGKLAVLNDNDFGLLDQEIPVDGSVPLNPNPTPVVLGLIDLGENNALDASNEDDAINIQNWPVFGLYQPDAIASFEANGQTYYVTANEGDIRDEEERIANLTLDPDAFPDAETLQQESQLGRLRISTIDGDLDNDGDFDQLFSYGGRSFSIWDQFGNLVFDSGDDFERITAQQVPELFNSSGTPDTFDDRSDNQGPEPEGIVTGVINDRTYTFIGLERIGGVIVYDVTNPTAPEFVQYLPNDNGGNPDEPVDREPEGLTFIPVEDSPNGEPLLIVAQEDSETITIFSVNPGPGTPLDDELVGTEADETIIARAGNDTVAGALGNDTIFGGNGDDVLRGDFNSRSSDNTLGGDDVIYGGAGSDRIGGKAGNDSLFGQKGDDQIWGDAGDDLLRGGLGNDTLFGDNGSGGDGSDTFILAAGEGTDTIGDFQVSEDFIGLADGLTFGQLSVTQESNNAVISFGDETLAILNQVQAETLIDNAATTFILVA
ncbi:choice-of-anchor I family protein [Moorena producens JHB]|uniref:Choice-of-anchor I family protein n=1 Tax=Moorena producens (strain JHB) TaxID=1454205 RepID=A0A1D9FY36_MOOP1|nr:choice-of-anchor I family protein [Moorena producens]AOY80277.1 choice-of-anchor I family protein [Moorena producens JHB]